MAQRSFESLQARESADSAIRLSILELTAPPSIGSELQVPGTRTVSVFGQPVTVTLELEAGRIDLNSADEFLLTAAFGGNGFPENEAQRMAERILDWRDADDSTGRQGAERNDYRRSGRLSGPRNGPFETVSELQQILGGESIPMELLDTFTVYSHAPNVRQFAAPLTVMKALRWADAKQLAGRTWLSTAGSDAGHLPEGVHGEVVRLQACARVERVDACRVAIVRFTGNPERPVLVFAWRTRYESI